MFEKLIKIDEKEFKKYLNIKGKYLYKQIYDILLDKNGVNVDYNDVKSIIRYDKKLRDVLYIYLATFEEYIRKIIIDLYDIDGEYDKRKLEKNLISNKNNENSKLYYCFDLTLNETIKLMKSKKLHMNLIADYKMVNKLRNHVMHHSMITCGRSNNFELLKENLNELKTLIKALANSLPHEFKQGFIKEINELKCDVDYFKINLEKN